ITTDSSSGTGFQVPDGTPVSFSGVDGSLNPTSSTLTSGTQTSTFTGTTPGAGHASVTVGNQTIFADITMIGPGVITGESSTTANGTYGVGSVITITVAFNEAVNVTGTPVLALNSGGTASYTSGSGGSTLSFTYTVGAGQNSNPLDEASSSALTLN